jgi:membrane dipeptidase
VTQEVRRNWSRSLVAVVAAFTMLGCGGEAEEPAAEAPRQLENVLDRARALHREVPLVDGHNDFPWALRRRVPSRDLARLDIRMPQPAIMTDIPRLRAGGVGAVFWAAYVPASTPGPEAVRMTHEQIDVVHRMAERYPDVFELARSAADVERIFAAGRIASLIGIEGGHSIDGSLETLRAMHARGVRYMTLTHSRNLPWADSATDTRKAGGLTPFGEEVVAEMNRLGMLVDLSHVSPDTMAHALRVTRAPVIFSHSSARALTDVPRNVPDDILRTVPANGGVVMVTFVPGFVSPAVAAYERREDDERRRLTRAHPKTPTAVERGLRAFRDANPRPRATLADVADHIDHVRAVAGIDHVGIGSDFDGIEHVPEGLEDVSTFPALTAELLRRGYDDEDVKKILGLNVLRVMREAERIAGGR